MPTKFDITDAERQAMIRDGDLMQDIHGTKRQEAASVNEGRQARSVLPKA